MPHKKRANQAELARVLGTSHANVSRAKDDPGFPEFDADKQAEIFSVVLWWANRGRGKQSADPDDLLQGEGTEGLERYRLAKAQQEEIKLATMRGQVVKLDDFNETASAMFAPWARVAEHVKRMGDDDTFQMIEEANEAVMRGLGRLYKKEGE